MGNGLFKKYFNGLDGCTLVSPAADREWESWRRRTRVADGMLNA